jgi:hypothetical protein
MTTSKSKIIDKHKKHELKLVLGPYGPHYAKFVCKNCNNAYVKWATKHEAKIYQEINQERTRNKKLKKALA